MYCIAIAGGTASGKTTFVNELKIIFKNQDVRFISIDDYYKPLTHLTVAERALINFDHPDAIDFDLLQSHLQLLSQEKPVNKPNYCFVTHDRKDSLNKILPAKVLVVEGILSLSIPFLKPYYNYTVFIDTPTEERMKRRMLRDVKERGRTANSVKSQFINTINPMHEEFVQPAAGLADMRIDGTQPLKIALHEISTLIKGQLF